MIDLKNLRTDKRHAHLDWHDVEKGVRHLKTLLPFKPQVIIGLTRGGVVPASLVHRYYPNSKLDLVSVKSYVAQAQVQPRIQSYDWQGLRGKRVLVVDDIYDTGETLKRIHKKLLKVKDCSVAYTTLVSKIDLCSLTLATYAYRCNQETWVYFPWERISP